MELTKKPDKADKKRKMNSYNVWNAISWRQVQQR